MELCLAVCGLSRDGSGITDGNIDFATATVLSQDLYGQYTLNCLSQVILKSEKLVKKGSGFPAFDFGIGGRHRYCKG